MQGFIQAFLGIFVQFQTLACQPCGFVHLRAQTFELAAENSVRLSVKEFELMQLLMLHREHAVSVDYIMNQIWSREPDVQPDTVWLYISYLKRKLKAIASETVIEGDETQGYILK